MKQPKHPAENLAYKKESAWYQMDNGLMSHIFSFNEQYKTFLNMAKTERETSLQVVSMARENGFTPINEIDKIQPGSRVMLNYRNKAVMMAVVGTNPIDQGCSIIGSHSDSPRLDLKPNPLYEKEDLALLKTHYYGGIKKYQWLGIPLALHGVVCLKNGSTISVVVGEESSDPVFTITDLLPHLAEKQMNKKMLEAVTGEGLNIIIGGIPLQHSEEIKNPVKLAILEKLYQQFGMTEEDFISAEFEVVPAWPARDVGLDRSMIGSYGQDDRVCVYTSLRAIMDINVPKHTAVTIFMDKEEIGSSGNTGMAARTFENFMAELVAKILPAYSELALRRCLANSKALSADVNAALDPNYEEVLEKMNACKLGRGVVITKYTGSRGKVHANDAHAEFMGYIRSIFSQNNIPWQTGELGKVDEGGGGTIAYLMAVYGMDVVDCGVPILGMHSPFEVASKLDVYTAYQAYKAFLTN
ncbi:aspartyl aminopeptidase [Desulfohalotomaculum tongense]|uniref:aminopeptidase n=1 Tax=Desulforadius tongensis TaxID=1216062 RepID=UPI00195A5E50|nr:aminopeptidase [Desulforadius tongensis]MBM7855803.1 aspartyl aminopeptidase [Desulforadius tongensis]